MFDDSFDVRYNMPRIWKDGSFGYVSLGRKGLTDYAFKGGDKITLDLEKCKVGEFVSFDDEHWGNKRIVRLKRVKTCWEFEAEYPDGKIYNSPNFLSKSDGKIFRKNIAKANRIRYYDYDIVVTCSGNYGEYEKDGLQDGKIYINLETGRYLQLKTFYTTFMSILKTNPNVVNYPIDTRWHFRDENFEDLVSFRFNNLIKWKPTIFENGSAKVIPNNVTFIDK